MEAQCKERRLSPEIHPDDEVVVQCLDQETIEGLREADRDWCHLSDWVAHRTKLLISTQEAWDNFRQIEVDLLDYLRDIERQIKNWEPINLEDEEAVAKRHTLLKVCSLVWFGSVRLGSVRLGFLLDLILALK